MSAGVILQAREYKLLLDGGRFVGKPKEVVAHFWEDRLKPIIARALGPRRSGAARHKKSFDRKRKRIVIFRDTSGHLLNGCGYILRERAAIPEDRRPPAEREITLKFRTPDLLLAAASLPTSGDEEMTFEEDIAPLHVLMKDASGVRTVVFADPRSMRSQFALSMKRWIAFDASLKTMRDAMRIHPALRAGLEKAGAGSIDLDAVLRRGPEIHERVFEGAEVEFGGEMVGTFAFTLWWFGRFSENAAPNVAEISFACGLKDGRSSGEAAGRASGLFLAMQEELGAALNMRDVSKTALGLPPFNPADAHRFK